MSNFKKVWIGDKNQIIRNIPIGKWRKKLTYPCRVQQNGQWPDRYSRTR